MKVLDVANKSNDPSINLCLDVMGKKKQAIVFCSTKRGAESQAEKIAGKASISKEGVELAEKALSVLATPTKQCKRLALCLKKGVAFHHAGLHAKQRELVEDNFRSSSISVICSTPTLAQGLDLPAFRVVIRDLKRFGGTWGMTDIPVLEYEQMSGRSGRPGKEEYGEAVILADTEDQEEERVEKFIHGDPEQIYSKLAVEPVLRTYVLSLIAAEFVTSTKGLHDFFSKTFYASQYGDMAKLSSILDAMIVKLEEWEFLQSDNTAGDFVSANDMADGRLRATAIGRRVAELYLDPSTANFLLECLRRTSGKARLSEFSILHMICSCTELRPLLRPRVREIDWIVEETNQYIDELMAPEPVQYSDEYEEFLMSLKTALFFRDWIDEIYEDALLEKYAITPGEVHAKLDRADWLLYAAQELARMQKMHEVRTPLSKIQIRVKHGAREELLALLKLRNIGRVRARKLYKFGIKSIGDVKTAEISTLVGLIGKATALSIKKEVGVEVDEAKIVVKPNKRKGQRSMSDY